jgi:parallel beta-helix repeat protein
MRTSTVSILTLVLASLTAATPVRAANVACNSFLDGVEVVLDGNVGPCSGVGVTLLNGATLDMNGFQLDCDGSPLTVGVNVQAGSTLRNGVIQGCSFAGVQVSGTGDSTVEYVNAGYNAGFGFNVQSSGKSVLRNNTALYNGNVGFYVATGENRVTGNSATDNTLSGFVLNGTGTQAMNNQASENGQRGFDVGSEQKLRGNVASANFGPGFRVYGTGSTLIGNTATINSWGIHVTGIDNTISKNVTTNNVQFGIYVEGGEENAISGNRVTGNEANGIFVNSAAENNVIKKNYAFANVPGDDLLSQSFDCGSNTWSDNLGQAQEPCVD